MIKKIKGMCSQSTMVCILAVIGILAAGFASFVGLGEGLLPERIYPTDIKGPRVEALREEAKVSGGHEIIQVIHIQLNYQTTSWSSVTKDKLYEKSREEWDREFKWIEKSDSGLERLASKVKNEYLKTDIQNLRGLLLMALENKDVDAIVLAHRLAHDLDYFIYIHDSTNDKKREYLGATVSLEGENTQAFKYMFKKNSI